MFAIKLNMFKYVLVKLNLSVSFPAGNFNHRHVFNAVYSYLKVANLNLLIFSI